MELISSRKNALARYAAKLSASAEFRREEGQFLIEGARLCADAAVSGVRITVLFSTEQAEGRYPEYLARIRPCAEQEYQITDPVAQLLSDTKSTQGIFCICAMNARCSTLDTADPAGKYAALENIQDPSNLGAVLRTAEAVGVDGVLLLGSCCDPFAPKALRAGMGAVFRLPLIASPDGADAVKALQSRGFSCYAAVPAADAVPITQCHFGGGSVILIGNEGNGLTPETIAACKMRITIPMKGRAESLNAASSAAILLWELSKN